MHRYNILSDMKLVSLLVSYFIPGFEKFNVKLIIIPASWPNGNILDSGAGGSRFKSRPGEIRHRLPMAHHCCNISLKGVVLSRCNVVKTGPTHSLHASAYYSKYNEDLI